MNHQHDNEQVASFEISRAFLGGIILNVIYVLVELWFGWQSNSTALLSDAVHNLGDVSGLLLAFAAFRLQKVKPGKIFTYGFKKVSVVASFINSVLLAFAIGAIAWEGWQRIINPSPINGITVMLVAGVGIVINFSSALLFKKREKDDLNIKAAYWHLLADALVSLGVVVAGLIIQFTGWMFIDGVASIAVALFILYSTWGLFKDSSIALMDGTPAAIQIDEIKSHMLRVEGVLNIHHLHIWSLSTNETAMTAHIVIKNLSNLQQIKHKLKAELQERGISHSALEFESPEEKCDEQDIL